MHGPQEAVDLGPTDAAICLKVACTFSPLQRRREVAQSLARAGAVEPRLVKGAILGEGFETMGGDDGFPGLVMGWQQRGLASRGTVRAGHQ